MKKRISILLVILWMILIFVMSSFGSVQSNNQSDFVVGIFSNLFDFHNLSRLSYVIRKIAHLLEYLILGILVANMIKNHCKKTYISFLVCVLYAISDEVHQLFVVGRQCQLLDILIDALGSLVGIFAFMIIYKLIRKRRQ